ncbi:hypothetical protein [Jeotgalibaca sp. A127]|uniref:hypothetical protein n=1 Tax=Jeotgalibaca sp. A127 TaxID=3457324 RepID=UPI003FD562BC
MKLTEPLALFDMLLRARFYERLVLIVFIRPFEKQFLFLVRVKGQITFDQVGVISPVIDPKPFAVVRFQIFGTFAENEDVVVNEFFYEVYRRVWNESIQFMIPLYAVLAFSWVNYRVIATFAPVVMPVFVVLWVIIFLTISYFFIFYGTLAGSPWQKLKDSLVLPWVFPLQSLGMLVGVGAIWLLNWRFSVIGILFLFSAPVALYYYLLRKKYWRHFRVK